MPNIKASYYWILILLLVLPKVSFAKAPTGEEAAQDLGAIVMEVTGITPAIEAVADSLGLSNNDSESTAASDNSNSGGSAGNTATAANTNSESTNDNAGADSD